MSGKLLEAEDPVIRAAAVRAHRDLPPPVKAPRILPLLSDPMRAVRIEWRRHLDETGAFRPADEVRALYESLGVTPNKTIIPYCQGGYRSANTYLVLRMLGYPQVRNYLGSWSEWGNRDDTTIVIPGED